MKTKNVNIRITEEQFEFIDDPRFKSKSEVVRRALDIFMRRVKEIDQLKKRGEYENQDNNKRKS